MHVVVLCCSAFRTEFCVKRTKGARACVLLPPCWSVRPLSPPCVLCWGCCWVSGAHNARSVQGGRPAVGHGAIHCTLVLDLESTSVAMKRPGASFAAKGGWRRPLFPALVVRGRACRTSLCEGMLRSVRPGWKHARSRPGRHSTATPASQTQQHHGAQHAPPPPPQRPLQHDVCLPLKSTLHNAQLFVLVGGIAVALIATGGPAWARCW
jgi:hypothetical protein